MRISDWSSDVCSSDLMRRVHPGCARTTSEPAHHECAGFHHVRHVDAQSAAGKYGECRCVSAYPAKPRPSKAASHRSEEHTSELQSLMRISYAVFCLKQKNTEQNQNKRHDLTEVTSTNYDEYTSL